MKITKERVEQILPQNIKETTLLSDNAKNVLAMMMHSLLVAKGAQDSGVLVISNNRLRALLEMNRDYMLNAIRELEEYELVTRIVGKTRIEGEPSTASEYHFNWDNIYNKPLKKKTSEELFSKFFKPSGTPSGTAITTTITTSTTTAIATSSAIASTNSIINSNTMTNSNKIEKQFEIDKKILLNKIIEKTNGLDFNTIDSVKIPIMNYISLTFTKNIDKLKNIAISEIERIKGKLREKLVSSTVVSVEDYLPF